MSQDFLDQIDEDFAEIYGEDGEFTQAMAIVTGDDSQTAYGILFKSDIDSDTESGLKHDKDKNWFVSFTTDSLTVTIIPTITKITIDSVEYGVRKTDPLHNNTTVVYLK